MPTKAMVKTDASTKSESKAEANPNLVKFFEKSQTFARQSRDMFVSAVALVIKDEISRATVQASLEAAGYTPGTAKVETSRIFKLVKDPAAFEKLQSGQMTVQEAREIKSGGSGGRPARNKNDKFLEDLTDVLAWGLQNATTPWNNAQGERILSPYVRFKDGTADFSTSSFEIEIELKEDLNDVIETAWEDAKQRYIGVLKEQKSKREADAEKKKGQFEADKQAAEATQAANQAKDEANQAEEQKSLTGVSA